MEWEPINDRIIAFTKRDICIVMGDMNAKVGCDNTGRERIMGKEGVGDPNENGELFADFCTHNKMVIGGTIFQNYITQKYS